MPRPILVRNHRRIACVLAGERAMAAHVAASPRRDASLATVDNITRSIADVLAQSSTQFDREKFYEVAGLKPFESVEMADNNPAPWPEGQPGSVEAFYD